MPSPMALATQQVLARRTRLIPACLAAWRTLVVPTTLTWTDSTGLVRACRASATPARWNTYSARKSLKASAMAAVSQISSICASLPLRSILRTLWPASLRAFTTWLPIKPDPPVTTSCIVDLLHKDSLTELQSFFECVRHISRLLFSHPVVERETYVPCADVIRHGKLALGHRGKDRLPM